MPVQAINVPMIIAEMKRFCDRIAVTFLYSVSYPDYEYSFFMNVRKRKVYKVSRFPQQGIWLLLKRNIRHRSQEEGRGVCQVPVLLSWFLCLFFINIHNLFSSGALSLNVIVPEKRYGFSKMPLPIMAPSAPASATFCMTPDAGQPILKDLSQCQAGLYKSRSVALCQLSTP